MRPVPATRRFFVTICTLCAVLLLCAVVIGCAAPPGEGVEGGAAEADVPTGTIDTGSEQDAGEPVDTGATDEPDIVATTPDAKITPVAAVRRWCSRC